MVTKITKGVLDNELIEFIGHATAASHVPLYSTHVGFSDVLVPAALSSGLLWGFYWNGDGGEKSIRRVHGNQVLDPASTLWVRSADRYLPDGTLDVAFGGWWETVTESPNVLQIGGRPDYVEEEASGTDLTPIFNKVSPYRKEILGNPGLFMVSGEGLILGNYGILRGPVSAGRTPGTLAQSRDYFDEAKKFILVPRNMAKVHTVNAMITDREPFGGVVALPNWGKAYTASSDDRMQYVRSIDYTNQDAVGATPATPRLFSLVVKVGRYGDAQNTMIQTTRHDGSLIASPSIMNFGDAPDHGFFCENSWQAKLRGCYAGWAFRDAAAFQVNHNAGDGETPAGDNFHPVDCTFQGFRGILSRGTDSCRVIAATSNTLTLPWWKSHQFGPSGTVRVDGAAYAYTGLTFTAGTPDVLTFTGVTPDPAAAGVIDGSELSRGEDWNDNGIGNTNFEDCHVLGLRHPSLRFPTDGAFSDRFDSPSATIEVGGAKHRGINFPMLHAHPRDEVHMFLHDVRDITVGGYAEPNSVIGTSAASGVVALAKKQMEAGVGAVPYPAGGCFNLRFTDDYDQTLTTDLSPRWRTQSSVGRFGSDWNLCAPEGGANPFYDVRSRDDGVRRFKAPGGLPGAKHPFQWLIPLTQVRGSMSQGGRWSFGLGIDTEVEPSNILQVYNSGGHLIDAINTASATNTGFRMQNTAGSASFLVNSEGRGVLLTSGASRFNFGSIWFAPSTDNDKSLGRSDFRFSTVYAATGTINTSDAREKDWLGPLSDAEIRAFRRLLPKIGKYHWLSSIAEKGDAARIHFGLTVQEVVAAFEAEGLDPWSYAPICLDFITKNVEEEVETEVLAVETVMASYTEVRMIDGVPTRLDLERPVERHVTEHVRVFNPDGSPAFEPDVDGNLVELFADLPKWVKKTEIVTKTVPDLDENGAQQYRLGLRNEQMMYGLIAAMASLG